MPTPSKATADIFRDKFLDKMQTANYTAATSLANASRLEPQYNKFSVDGPLLATEMTNRMLQFADPEIKQIYCDARKWFNADRAAKGSLGYGASRINNDITPADEYTLEVQYNGTYGSGGFANPDQHFFNLVIKLPGNRKAQIAHLTFYSTVDNPATFPGRKPWTWTPLGFFHLKDDLALGQLNAAGTAFDATKPNQHTTGIKPATATSSAKIIQSFRRYFVNVVTIPAVAAVPAKKQYEIGLQNQSGNVSRMAASFGKLAITVLQEYFDNNFTANATVLKTGAPANPYVKANLICIPPAPVAPAALGAGAGAAVVAAPVYTVATDIGNTVDIPPPAGQIGSPQQKKNMKNATKFGILGGKRKTRRGKTNRRAIKRKTRRV